MQDYFNYQSCQADRWPIAMAYVPWQHFDGLCEDFEKGYETGTIFPQLDKPFTGRRCTG